MTDIDSFEELDKLQEEENAARNQFKNILTLKDGDSVTFRLLREVLPFYSLREHHYFDSANRANGFRAVCAADEGKPCHYCALAEKLGKSEMRAHTSLVLPIFISKWHNPRANAESQTFLDSQVGEQKLWIIKIHSKQTQHTTLREFYTRYKTGLCSDWILARRGEGKLATYTLAGYRLDDKEEELPLLSKEQVQTFLYETIPYRVLEEEVVQAPF